MSFSVKETEHKLSIESLITGICGKLPTELVVSALSPLTIDHAVDSPPVCSDGFRRPNVLDYIDYLFQNPTIEQYIKTSLGTKTYSIIITAGITPRQFRLTITNTGVLPTLVIRSIASPGSTLPVTLTLATQVNATSGTTFTNASPSAGPKWDSGFSSALPLSSGYLTATPGAFISQAYTFSQVGLSTSALVVPGNTGNPVSFSVSYGFYLIRNPRTNSTTPGSISLYKIVPGGTPGTAIQIGTSSYTTAPALNVSYDGQSIRYSINGLPATNTTGGGSTAIAVSLNTLHATALFAFSGDSLTSVTWGSSLAGPKGADGAIGNAGVQGPAGVAGPAGPGFTAISPTTTNCVLTANGTSNTATAQTNVVYQISANTVAPIFPASTLTAPNLAASTGAVIAPIASTIPGTLRTGFSSFTARYTTSDYNSAAAKVVLSGLQTSGLYICSIAGMTGSNYTKLSQIYITKTGVPPTTSFVATKFGTDIPATSVFTWNMPTIVPQTTTTPSSFSLSFSASATVTVSVSITLVASTPNLY